MGEDDSLSNPHSVQIFLKLQILRRIKPFFYLSVQTALLQGNQILKEVAFYKTYSS